MSHSFIEFRDFEYIKEVVSVSEKIVKTVYVKVLDNNEEYLGTIRFGLYTDFEGVKLNNCISDVVSQNYPDYKSYESEITKI